MQIYRILACSLFAFVPMWADSLPTLNTTIFNFSYSNDGSYSWSGSGPGFDFTAEAYDESPTIYPGGPISTETYFPGPEVGIPMGSYVAFPGVSGFATLEGGGGTVTPDDPANLIISSFGGTYSFAASAVGSYEACFTYTTPFTCVDNISIDLQGVETLTVTPATGYNLPGYVTYGLTFAGNPVPEPSSIGLLLLGSLTAFLARRSFTRQAALTR